MTGFRAAVPAAGVPEGERLGMLDLLRGFALLGIFMVNMQFFTMYFGAFIKPAVYQGGPLIDVLAWGFVKTFCEYKFISLFSLLFGAGMVLQMTRARAKGRPFVPSYLRRMAVLAVIGLIHGYLLWYGDILFIYSVIGTVLLLGRKWRPRTLLIVAGAIIAFFCAAQFTLGVIAATGAFDDFGAEKADEEPETPAWSEENPKLAERFPWMAAMFDSGFEITGDQWAAAETAAYKEGPFTDALAFRAITYTLAVLVAVFGYGWRVLACFLIGAALMKLGVFARSARRWHRRMFFIGMGLGVPAELANAWFMYLGGSGDRVDLAMIGATVHEPGSLLMCLGFVGGAGMIVSSGIMPRFVRAISAVGRLALSNYLLQTVVATFLMYSWGLGYFGEVPRPWQVALVVVIYGLQIPLSVLWLRFFTIGPMEWIWRSLTYRKRQSMRRRRI